MYLSETVWQSGSVLFVSALYFGEDFFLLVLIVEHGVLSHLSLLYGFSLFRRLVPRNFNLSPKSVVLEHGF